MQLGKRRHFLSDLQHRCHTSRPSTSLTSYLLPRHFYTVDHYPNQLYCGDFTADGEYFLVGCKSGDIMTYRVEGSTLNRFSSYSCNNVHFSIIDTKVCPRREKIAYSSLNGYVYLVDFACPNSTEWPLRLLDRADMGVVEAWMCAFSLSFSADGRELIAGLTGGMFVVYDLEAGTDAVRNHDAHLADVNCVSFAPGSSHVIYSSGDDGILKVWDRRIISERAPAPVAVFVGHAHGITRHDARQDLRYLLTNSKDQSIKMWDVRRPSAASALASAETVAQNNSQLWDYRQCEVARPAGVALDLARRQADFDQAPTDDSVLTLTGHAVCSTLVRARFSPTFSTGQRYIYSGSADGRVYVWEVQSGRLVLAEGGHIGVVRDVDWHPTEPMILSCSFDKTLGCYHYTETSSLWESYVDHGSFYV